MKKLFILLFLLNSFISKADYWTRKADFPAGYRKDAYGFSIGNKGYVGGGYFSNSSDLWEYNLAANIWTQKANLPSGFKRLTASFAIGNKGYVCTGTDTSGNFSNYLFEYDPTTDNWTQKANFPGLPRSGASVFVIGNIGYVGIGAANTICTNDFYAYNPAANSWTAIASLPTSGYWEGFGFSITNQGYITGLGNCVPAIIDTIWEYNSLANSWSAKANFPDTPRTDAASFAINNMGYFGTGDCVGCGSNLFNDWWQYNPNTNAWTQKASIPSTTRDETTYFAINNKGYICFGGENHNAELWEYTPDSTTDAQGVNNQKVSVQVFPNPFSTKANLYFGRALQNAELSIADVTGREIERYINICGREFILNRNSLSPGIYFYRLVENGIVVAKDKMMVW